MSQDLVAEGEWTAVASSIDACRQQLQKCEREYDFYSDQDGEFHDTEMYDSERQYLSHLISQANFRMLILIERTGMPLFRQSYASGFEKFDGKLDKLTNSHFDPQDLFSEPLVFISHTFDALTSMLRQQSSAEAFGLGLFERVLRQAPFIIQDQGIEPNSEAEVRKALFDILKVVFPDVQREVPVPHIFKTYRADLGSRSLKALSEVKFAVTETELKAQIGGIYEDMKGYSGDPHWNNFFALFYTTSPIASPERIEAEFKLSRVDMSWIPIIVHGTGARKRKKALDRSIRSDSAPPNGAEQSSGNPA